MSSISDYNLPKEDRKKVIDLIISFFLDERGEEMGVIAASELLDFLRLRFPQ